MERSPGEVLDTSLIRVVVAVVVGVIVTVAAAAASRRGHVVSTLGCGLSGWIVGVAVFLVWTWLVLWRMDGKRTKSHATGEDLTRRVAHFVMLLASAASVGGVGHLLIAGSLHGKESLAAALIGVVSVAAAWCVVHTVFTLHYAKLYYTAPDRPIEFNNPELPAYSDFAYLAFTVGMAYAVSDNNLKTQAIRKKVLLHGLISYVLGAAVIAVTINLLAGLGPRS
jgi:uncharacterized membrane protein